MGYKNNEKLIIAIACILTVLSVLGITLIGGDFKSNKERETSKLEDKEIAISSKDYEIIRQDEKKDISTFIILEKKKFNNAELIQLSTNIIKDMTKTFNIYIFDDKETAKSFNYEKDKIKKLIKSMGQQELKIQTCYTLKEETEDIPQYYILDTIKNDNGIIKVSLTLESIENPKKAIGQMKFLGQIIKDLNKYKKIEKLEMKAESKDYQGPSWEYSSENKKLIIKNEIVEI